MNICLSAFDFLPGKYGGVEIYFRNLIHYLREIDGGNSYLVLCNRVFADSLPPSEGNIQVKIFDFRRFSVNWFARNVIKRTVKVDIVNSLIRRMKPDVVHHPFTILNPLALKVPSVLTFHDMQQEFFPDFFARDELTWRNAAYRASASEATRIIAISEFTKRCLVERYGIDEKKIDVVYQGYNPRYNALDDVEGVAAVKRKYGLDGPFMFYPAAGWPHKNHGRLLAAIELLKLRHRFDGKLVLTGIALQSHDEIVREMVERGLSDTVKVLGYVSFDELPRLYKLARLTVFPSLFEGFGIPVVESMACGCPVACSNVTSLPEVAGDAGLMFDPYSVEDIAGKIWSVWDAEGTRKEMIAAGLERVKMFDWADSVRKTVEVYRKAAGCWTAVGPIREKMASGVWKSEHGK